MFNVMQPHNQAITINTNTIPELTEENFEAFLDSLNAGNIFFLQVATSAAVSIGLPSARYTGIYHRYTEGIQNMIFFPISEDVNYYKKYKYSASDSWSAWVSC